MSRTSNTIAWVSVCISFAVIISAIAIVDGFKSEIRSKISDFMGSAVLVQPGQHPVNEEYPFSENLSYRSLIDSLPGVESVRAAAYRSGLVKTADNIEGLCFKGVDCGPDADMNEIRISSAVARRLKLGEGDKLTVYFIGEDVKVRRFTIGSLFDSQLDEIDSKFAYVDIRQIRRLNAWKDDDASSLEIRFKDGANEDALLRHIADIEAYMSKPSDAPLFVTSVRKYYAHLFDWLALLDLNVLMVIALMIAVAGFNMISAVLILLFEKISMIGLLKSLGMTSHEVGKVFRRRSAALVGKGLVVGNLIGTGLCLIQKYTHAIKLDAANYFVDHVPVSLDFWKILLIDAAAFILIMLIVSLSSLFISKVSPEKTLKVE